MNSGQGQERRPSAAQLGRVHEFSIPADAEDWNYLVSHTPSLKDLTIHNIPADRVASASEASNAQYMMLRSYSPRVSAIDTFLVYECGNYGFTSEYLEEAHAVLADSTEWSRYLQLIDTGDSIDGILATSDRWPGAFSTTSRLHEQTMAVQGIHDRNTMQGTAAQARVGSATGRPMPQRIPEFPDVEDEATPNAAAIILLQTVSHFADSNLEWVLNRVQFVCEFQSSKFTALKDGALRPKRTLDIFAIVEVKKRMRTVNREAILTQETCEVVRWLMHSSGEMAHFNHHFMLISQDRHELFITFVPFSQAYENYLRNGTRTTDFLVMNTFGPFRTAYRDDMEDFGRIILATMLIAKRAAS
ncbi:hypothetical protein N7519_006453 [Penicillium mononematosum]|uniref:uncharacterized protein n=1 Tax=Penicillium mononematosum TaxID=268346 RepID=UPI0025495411|nr:uncharacterized protein N7519_006453 [Penicillium mononematosum]KAJ6185152.1 hypothetical protein N7519_006453 [Penicillium mononematosum]